MPDIEEAAAALAAGEAVILPTDTVYGLGVAANVPGATARLFAIKRRSTDVPVAVLVGSLDDVRSLVATIPPSAARLAARYWPGPLTLVLHRRRGLELDLGGRRDQTATIGVRCPDEPLVQRLAARVGPLAVTSANRHGQPTPATAADALAALGGPGAVSVVIDGGPRHGIASTVVDCTASEPRVLREGPISIADIIAVAGE